MPTEERTAQVIAIIRNLESLHLSLDGDPANSKFWVTLELFHEIQKDMPNFNPKQIRESVVKDLLTAIGQLKLDIDIESGDLPSPTEANLIHQLGVREQKILDLESELAISFIEAEELSKQVSELQRELTHGR